MKSDLNEWDDAEAEAEAKDSAKRGEKLNRPHSNASLQLWTGSILNMWSVLESSEIRVSCTYVIFLLFSIFRLTHDGLLSKEDVKCGQIFLPGIVCGWCFTHVLKTDQNCTSSYCIRVDLNIETVYLWLQFNEGVVVLLPVGVGQPLDVTRQRGFVLSLINLFHLCKHTCFTCASICSGVIIRWCSYLVPPQFRNRSIFQGTQRVQVKVSGVARPEDIWKLPR